MLLLVGFLGGAAHSQGLLPVPNITGATVSADAALIQGLPFGGEYEYQYTINSPSTATGNIWLFEVDVSSEERLGSAGSTRSYPIQGGAATASMEEDADLLDPFFGERGREVLVVNQLAPAGWNGGLTRHAFVQFAVGDSTFSIQPGTSASGLNIQVARPPTIRQFSLTPDWVLLVDDHDLVTDQEVADGAATTQSLPVTGFTLGPLDISPGGFPHYNRFSTDMRSAEFMEWVTNVALVNSLETSLGTARNEVFIGNNGLALAALQEMLDSIAAADPSTFNTEFLRLVELNVTSLMGAIPTFNNTFIPVFEATPDSADLLRGETFSLTMRHFNSALEGNPPLENLRVLVRCAEGFTCANIDQLLPGTAFRIDETGQVIFSYIGQNAGFDLIEVVENDFEAFRQLALAEVNWRAEVDLVVPAFVPPFVGAVSGDTIFLTDRTTNKGIVDVTVPTITRYYISSTEPADIANPVIDIATATVIGERTVPPLGVNEFSDSLEVPFVVPPGFDGEVHYLAACADAENVAVESLEDNNCSFSEFEIEVYTAALVVDPATSLVNLSIDNATDLEGDIGTQALSFDVTISESDPQNDITVDFSTQDGTALAGVDYEALGIPLVFPAGTTSLTQSIPVNVIGDFDVEDDETFSVVLSNPSSNAEIATDTATGTIQNDDLVSVTVGDVSALEGNSGTTAFLFPVIINQPHPSTAVVVDLETLDGDALAGQDYTATTQQLTFAAATTILVQDVIVNVTGDDEVEPDEGFTLNINSVSANAAILDSEGSGTILNDDSPRELDCSNATASPNALWPPNHKLVTINVGGVFDLDGSNANIVVTGIEQDEPVNGLGDGDTSPDGFGVGTDSPQVRRERSGLGDGRIYFISFDASDTSSSASCSGQVTVGVPHDQGQGSTPIDSGMRFDSTVP